MIGVIKDYQAVRVVIKADGGFYFLPPLRRRVCTSRFCVWYSLRCGALKPSRESRLYHVEMRSMCLLVSLPLLCRGVLSKRTQPLLDDLDVRLCICGHLKPRPRRAEHVRRRWRLLCEHRGVLSPPIAEKRSQPSVSRPFFTPSFTCVCGGGVWASTAKIFQDGLISLPPEIPAQHLCRCDQTSIKGQLWRLTPGLFGLKALKLDYCSTVISIFLSDRALV